MLIFDRMRYIGNKMKTIVLKFGSSVLKDLSSLDMLVHVVRENIITFKNIIIIVSAIGKTTDALGEVIEKVDKNACKRESDMLLAVGERVSASLVAIALKKNGLDSISFTGSQTGIITNDEHTQAKIIEVRPSRIKNALKENKLVVVAGFQGVSESKEVTTLGRGGSDVSAVALALALDAYGVIFYKDVCGLYNKDPNQYADAIKIQKATFEEASTIIAKSTRALLHPRALGMAQQNQVPIWIKEFKPNGQESCIYSRCLNGERIYEDKKRSLCLSS